MAVTRKEFLKKACLSGACLCGAVPAVMAGSQNNGAGSQDQTAKNPNELQQEWISVLLDNIDDRLTEDELRSVLKSCSLTHYNAIGMESITSSYKGRLEDFLKYLENDWHWKIEYDKTAGVIIADENKSRCVCPMVNREKGVRSAAICYCSEGFIEKMFSDVVERPVISRVLTSVLRGDPACRYQVKLT